MNSLFYVTCCDPDPLLLPKYARIEEILQQPKYLRTPILKPTFIHFPVTLHNSEKTSFYL